MSMTPNPKADAEYLCRWARRNGLRPIDTALLSIDTRSSAWQRLSSRSAWLRLRLASVPAAHPVAILMVLRSEARRIMAAAGRDARYADNLTTLETEGVFPLILVDDGAS
jgi:hypothetical protein